VPGILAGVALSAMRHRQPGDAPARCQGHAAGRTAFGDHLAVCPEAIADCADPERSTTTGPASWPRPSIDLPLCSNRIGEQVHGSGVAASLSTPCLDPLNGLARANLLMKLSRSTCDLMAATGQALVTARTVTASASQAACLAGGSWLPARRQSVCRRRSSDRQPTDPWMLRHQQCVRAPNRERALIGGPRDGPNRTCMLE
jgi:hypothetical protein